jgi:hypothetical protein
MKKTELKQIIKTLIQESKNEESVSEALSKVIKDNARDLASGKYFGEDYHIFSEVDADEYNELGEGYSDEKIKYVLELIKDYWVEEVADKIGVEAKQAEINKDTIKTVIDVLDADVDYHI